MTNEQFEKHVTFILGQQAQFRVDMQLLKEAQARTERVVTRTEQVVARNAEAIARTSQVAEKALHSSGSQKSNGPMGHKSHQG